MRVSVYGVGNGQKWIKNCIWESTYMDLWIVIFIALVRHSRVGLRWNQSSHSSMGLFFSSTQPTRWCYRKGGMVGVIKFPFTGRTTGPAIPCRFRSRLISVRLPFLSVLTPFPFCPKGSPSVQVNGLDDRIKRAWSLITHKGSRQVSDRDRARARGTVRIRKKFHTVARNRDNALWPLKKTRSNGGRTTVQHG